MTNLPHCAVFNENQGEVMENFLNNDYDTLANVANGFIQKCFETQQINIGEFYQNMEAGFAKFNFRNKKSSGGG